MRIKIYLSLLFAVASINLFAIPDTLHIDAMLYRALILNNSNTDSAEILAQKALKLSLPINYKKGISRAYLRIGVLLGREGNIDSALVYLRKAVKIRIETRDKMALAGAYREISYLYKATNNFDSAFYYCLKALRINEQIGDKSEIGINSNDVGTLLLEYGNYTEAKKYFDKGLELVIASKDSSFLGLIYNSIGEYYYKLSEYNSAKQNFMKALVINTNIKNEHAASQNQTNLGACYLELNQFILAKNYYKKSIDFYVKNKVELELAIIYNALGTISFKENLQDSAIKFLNKSISIASRNGFIDIEALSYKTLAKTYELSGKFTKALEAERKYEKLNDSIFTREKIKQIADMQTKYDTDKKDKEIVILNSENKLKSIENKRQLIVIIATLILLITIGLFLGLVFYQKRRITLEKLRSDQLVLDKEMLIKEIHHRVKNNLEVISSLLELQSEGIKDHVAKAAVVEGQNRVQAIALIHHQLYRTDDVASVEFRLFVSELYKQIESIFKKDDSIIQFEILANEMNISIDAAVPIGLILNELLTNTFKYAISNTKQNKIIIELIPADQGELNTIIFRDNGPGMPESIDIEKSNSLGMKVIKLLTRQLGGKLKYYNRDGSVFEIPFRMIK